jgi:biopolymer transport protein ExbD
MIPLIDIVFLLLVVFVFAMMSMTIHKGVRVDLPYAATADPNQRDYFSVTLTRAGEIFVGLDPVSVDDLSRRVAAAKQEDANMRVFVNAHKGVPYGRVVEVLDGIRSGGVTAVSLQTEGTHPGRDEGLPLDGESPSRGGERPEK